MDIEGAPFLAIPLPMGVRSQSNRIVVSCCLNINKYFKGLSPDSGARYDDFYRRLQNLRTALNSPGARMTVSVGASTASLKPLLKVEGPEAPFLYSLGEVGKDLSLADYEKLRRDLWQLIFPPAKTMNVHSRVPDPPVGRDVVQIASDKSLRHMTQFISNKLGKQQRQQDMQSDGPDITRTLQSIRDFAQSSEKRAAIEKLKFIRQHNSTARVAELEGLIEAANEQSSKSSTTALASVTKLAKTLADVHYTALDDYLASNYTVMDIDEVILSYSSLSNEPELMRLMGLTRDCEITLPPDLVPNPGAPTYFYLKIEVQSATDALALPTRIKGICSDNRQKYAYLVAENLQSDQPHFFDNSILRVLTNQPSAGADPWRSHLYTFDKVAQELKLRATIDAQEHNSGAVGEDPEDSFTRGIIFGNTGLAEMVKPAAYPFTSDNSTTLPEGFAFSEDFVSHGHRVGAIINDAYYSLTRRRLELRRLKSGDAGPFFVSDLNEGPIHFDAVSNFVHNGELKSAVSDALFEYSGELLGLKSAFSRSTTITKADHILRLTENHDDGGLFKSHARVEQTIQFTRFPAEVNNGQAYLSCHYDLPTQFTPKHSPRLRFNKVSNPRKYTFVVYQEYLNGWGLPLESLSTWPLQLSVKDLTERNPSYLPPAIKFSPLESKKPLLLFHTKDPDGGKSPNSTMETASSATPRPVDKEALETLVIWSEDTDGDTHSCSRHVLPARIAFEHAFWYDLLSELDGDQSFDWKRKYNCPFLDQQQYDNFTTGRAKQKCPENNCSSYCGGTAMRTFYSGDQVVPNHLSDPSITGFSVLFFRDSQYANQISQAPVQLKFGGTPGLSPQSCLVKVDGSKRELETMISDDKKTLTIRLKPGMRVWAQLENVLSEEYRDEHLNRAWYQDLATIHSESLLTVFPLKTGRNPRRPISIIHAAKKPVVTPTIETFSSKPTEDYKCSHVKEWLTGEYADLTIESNVVATRLKMQDTDLNELGSSIIGVKIQSRFERLDAFVKDGKVAFVNNELPTGGLELWMRKEEYIDDPNQIVFRSDSQQGALIDHLPDEPVVPFKDLKKNISHRDYRIEFTDDVMHQLKVPVTVGDRIGDVFRELTSTIDLRLDAKSKKFEERRYTLRNTSIFKGLFTDKEDDKDIDYTRESSEHRVLLLNNTQPAKPEVSHALTTITEVRGRNHHHATTSHQKGNIVTIYLKRNRLSSGKNERVGVIVYNDNSRYHNAFVEGDFISKAGRDIVSDQNQATTASPFIRYDRNDTTKQDIIISDGNEFDGRFHEDLGIVSYLPQFERERQLWKFEVELDIKTPDGFQLHNPFVLFSLVHFQPFSVNYNAKWPTRESKLKDMSQDFRLSSVETFVWCYLLPERRLSVSFCKPLIWGLGPWFDFLDRWGSADLTISFDNESLHYFETDSSQSILRSNFVLSVEGSNDKVAWYPVVSQVDNGTGKWGLAHPLLTKANLKPGNNEAKLKVKFSRASNPAESGIKTTSSHKFSEFRVRLVEVEWFVEQEWDHLNINNYTDIVENEDMRVRYVELIY